MKSEIPFSGMGAKNTAKTQPPSPAETEFFFLDLTERGNSDDIAHGSIIQALTVYNLLAKIR